MLAGKRADLGVRENGDIPMWHDWFSDPQVAGLFLRFPRQGSE